MNPTNKLSSADGNLAAVTRTVISHTAEIHGHELPHPIADAMAIALDTALAHAIESAVAATEHELVFAGFKSGLVAALGAELGQAVFARLAGRANVSNAVLCPNYTRSAVSKYAVRARRNLRITGGHPNNARAGRAPRK